MTRLAYYYEDPRRIGRNDGPPLYWWNATVKMFGKDNSIHLIPNGDWSNFGKFDLNMWVDFGEDALMPHLSYKPLTPPSPNVYVCSDAHIGYEYRLTRAREFDWVFCNQKRACEEFVRDGIPKDKCFWLPHAAEPLAYPHKDIIKKYDVCFIGNMNCWERVDFCDRMFKEFPNYFYGKRIFDEAAEKFCESRMVLNTSIKDDINMRVFETLSTKSLLLTNELPTLGELFQDGVHLVTYKDTNDAVEKARYYLAHEDEANKIAQAGYDEFIKKHTYTHRVKTVLEMMKQFGVLV